MTLNDTNHLNLTLCLGELEPLLTDRKSHEDLVRFSLFLLQFSYTKQPVLFQVHSF